MKLHKIVDKGAVRALFNSLTPAIEELAEFNSPAIDYHLNDIRLSQAIIEAVDDLKLNALLKESLPFSLVSYLIVAQSIAESLPEAAKVLLGDFDTNTAIISAYIAMKLYDLDEDDPTANGLLNEDAVNCIAVLTDQFYEEVYPTL